MIIEDPQKRPEVKAQEEPPPDNLVHVSFGRQTEIANVRAAHCRHHSYQVDAELREVRCGACGAQLDPLEVLLQYARRERTWRHFDGETRQKRKELEELQAEERKTKARLKSASRKDADTAVAAERARSERERFEIIQAARDIAASCRRIEQITTRRRTTT